MLRIQSRNLHSWMSLFRTTRGSVTVLAVAGLGLVLPAQIGDELAALKGMTVGPVPGLLVLQFALGSLAISAWYWARAALAARFGVDDALEARQGLRHSNQRAFDVVPRLSFLSGVALALILLWRGPSWPHALAIAAWAVPAYLLIRWRLAVCAPTYRSTFVNHTVLRSRRHIRQWLRVIFPRLRALLMLAPFGPRVSIPFLAIGLAGFGWGAVESFISWNDRYPGLPALAARIFPGPSVALVGFALLIGPLTALIFIMDGLRLETTVLGRLVRLSRPPVISGLLLVLLVAPLVFSLHSVRVLPPNLRALPIDQRAPLGAFFANWAQACAPDPDLPVRPIIVAISGGGSRAGIWGAQVLAAVDTAAGQRNAAVFAVSSVSGGSLGAAAYMAVMRATGARCQRPDGAPAQVRTLLDRLNNVELGGDALGPLLAGALLSDTPRTLFSPVAALLRLAAGTQPHGGDRAEALERAFEGLWLDDLRQVGLQHAGLPLFSDSFLSLWYQHGQLRPGGMPVWIVNGTDLASGERMLTEPMASHTAADWPFRSTGDVLGVLGADVAISTAINNGARFPYLEPSGELISAGDKRSQMRRGRPELLDGAYFDDEGLLTAAELAEWLKRQTWHGRPVEPIIVQATADAAIVAAASSPVVRCPDRPVDVPTDLPSSSETPQLLVPIVGLYHALNAHEGVLLREVRDRFCGVGDQRAFFHFYLFHSAEREIPLNWLLSPPIVAAIREQLSAGSVNPTGGRNGNDGEYHNLFETVHGTLTAADP